MTSLKDEFIENTIINTPPKIENFDFCPLTVAIVLISKWNMIDQMNIYHIPQKCIFMIYKYKIMFIFR